MKSISNRSFVSYNIRHKLDDDDTDSQGKQRKAALPRRVEVELDEADETVCVSPLFLLLGIEGAPVRDGKGVAILSSRVPESFVAVRIHR